MEKVMYLFIAGTLLCASISAQSEEENNIVLERWKDRLTFIHLGPAQIFYYTQEEFDRKAKEYKDLGLTHILFMSPFHCRMSYHQHWDYILEAMRKFTIALHKQGLKAVEHFSVVNPHNVGDVLIDAHGTREMYNYLPGLEALIADDNGTINGHRVSSFYQIDGSTGKPFFNPMYKNYSLCVNNPYYKEILFQHLEDIYALGIDGIMTDDLEHYSINSCACEHCRAAFRKQYGYDLPATSGWASFVNYKNPQYIDWLRFRHEKHKQFQYDVNAHYEKLGKKNMVRPNYVSTCLMSNLAAYPFEAASPLWTHTFAENVYGLKTGHLTFACEAAHRTAMGERTDAASLTMLYPNTDNETYFSYANAWCWGQSFLGGGVGDRNRPFIQYETKHWNSLFAVRKNSDLAVYFSTDTRDFTQSSETRYQRPLVSWMQATYLSGLNMDMVFKDDPVEVLSKHRAILASHIAMISNGQLERLRQYVNQGGTLIAVSDFGVFDETGSERNAFSAFDVNIQTRTLTPKRTNLSFNGKTITDAYVNSCISGVIDGTPLLRDNDGNVIAISKTYGKGKIIVIPSSIVGDWYQEPVLFYYLTPDVPGGPPMADAPTYRVDNLRNSAGVLLKEIISTPVVDIKINNPDILGFYHTNWDGTIHAVKLLNIAETFVKEKRRFSDTEPIVNFNMSAAKLPYEIEINIPDIEDFPYCKAVLSSPEKTDTEIEIQVQKKDGRLYFTVPANYFSGFVLIEITQTEKVATGTGSVENLSENPLRARIQDGMLHVSGLTPGKMLSVYTVTGALEYHNIAASNEANIKLKTPGVYIVHSEGNSIKVVFE